MSGKNGSVTSAKKDQGTPQNPISPPVYSAVVSYPADPGPPPVAAHDDTYIFAERVDWDIFANAVGSSAKFDCSGANNADPGTYTKHT